MNQRQDLSIFEKIQKKNKASQQSQSSIDTQNFNDQKIMEEQQIQIKNLQELSIAQMKKIDELTKLLLQTNQISNQSKPSNIEKSEHKKIIESRTLKQCDKRRRKNTRSDSLSSIQSQDQLDKQNSQESESNLYVDSNEKELEEQQIREIQKSGKQQQPLAMEKQSFQTNKDLFERIQNLVQKQNEKKTKQIQDAQIYKNNLTKQDEVNKQKLQKKSDFYCSSSKLSFKTINYLQNHNNNFHKDNALDDGLIRFTCQVCQIVSFNTNEGCLKHQEKCLQSYVSMINSQEGSQVLILKDFNQEEQSLINFASKCLRKDY